MGFAKLVKHGKVTWSYIFLIGDIIVGNLDVGFLHLFPVSQVGVGTIYHPQQFRYIILEISTCCIFQQVLTLYFPVIQHIQRLRSRLNIKHIRPINVNNPDLLSLQILSNRLINIIHPKLHFCTCVHFLQLSYSLFTDPLFH